MLNILNILMNALDEYLDKNSNEHLDQSCKLLRYWGTLCPVGLETSSRILKVDPTLFAASRFLRVAPALFFFILLAIFGLIIDIAGLFLSLMN